MSEPSPCITAIIPCYNAENYLAQALDSVFAQAPAPDEVIVIDDGSTDGSAAIALGYGDARITCRRQDNQGIAATRNHGLSLARGELIAFLDADDLWPQESLGAKLLRLESEPDLDGVFGRVECFISPELPEAIRAGLSCPRGAQAGRLAGSLLLRRRVFERVGEFDTRLQVGELIDWLARADERGVRLAEVDTVVLRRRIHGANSVLRTQRLQTDYLRVLRAALERRRAETDELESLQS